MRRSDKQITHRDEIDEILLAGEVCHLALKDEPFPYVIPLNYGYGTLRRPAARDPAAGDPAAADQPALLFHGADSGRKIDLMRRDPRAAFVVDVDHRLVTDEEACRFTMHYRSVMGHGTIVFLDEADAKRYALNRIMAQYSGRDDWPLSDGDLARVTIFALLIEELSGKS